MEHARVVRHPGLRGRRLRRRLSSGNDPVFRERRSDLHRCGSVGFRRRLHRPGLRSWSVHGSVLARPQAVQRAHSSNVRRDGQLARRRVVRERLQWRCLLRELQPGGPALQRSHSTDL
jgi:hypothetical protein